MKRRGLQIIVAAVGFILVFRMALPGAILGAEWVAGGADFNALMDSEVRFLSILAGGLGAILFWIIPRIERATALVDIIMAATFVGGLLRVVSYFQVGVPPSKAMIATAIELVVPLLVIPWQRSVARDQPASRVGVL